MSREIGKVKLHNGGLLEVTSYIGPTDKPNRRRIQFTLTQAEGGIHAYGNTDADGVAELVGVLETWLLEGGAPVRLERADVIRGSAYKHAEALLDALERLGNDVAFGPGGNLVDECERHARALLGILEAPARRAADDVRLGAAVDGPSRAAVETFATPERLEEFATATPASDFLEEHDTVRGLEDYGAIGEEDAFTRALNRRRNGQGPETAAGSAGVYTAGGVELAAGEARRALEELVKYCGALEHKRPADLTELGPVTHYAARFLESKLTLSESLDAAARQGGK